MLDSAYSIPAPFMPLEFERKGIDQITTGWIFAIYSLAIVLFSPLVPSFITRYGRRTPLMLGMILLGVSFIMFGLLQLISSTIIYIIIAMLCRFL